MFAQRLAGLLTLRLVRLGVRHPRRVVWTVVAATLLIGVLMVRVEVDTDPENMLPSDHPVRVLNSDIRETFGGDQVIVVGLVGDGALTADQLSGVSELHRSIAADPDVRGDQVVSLASALGAPGDPVTSADSVADAVADNPLLDGLVLTPAGDAAAIFVPITSKDTAAEVSDRIDALAAAGGRLDSVELHTAGLPLAQDAFGAQMFLQMGLFAPLAGGLIFLLMWFFFRRLSLVIPAMAVALLTVIATMGLLIGTGNTVHIMSSMIAIFLMPTAILDSVHVLSEFFDRYRGGADRESVMESIYGELAGPLLFTTLTTMVGFGSLSLAPIPPVKVFGLFVAVGMALAWLYTVLFLPAYLMLRRPEGLVVDLEVASETRMARFVRAVGRIPVRRPVLVVAALVALVAVAVPAIPRIDVNDNPVNWFRSDHEVRRSTEALNEILPGTFGANIVLEAGSSGALTRTDTLRVVRGLESAWADSSLVGSASTIVDLIPDDGSDAAAVLEASLEQSPLTAALVTADLESANLRLLLNDGDNQSMQEVIDLTAAQLAAAPFPDDVSWRWGGETYLNLVWQEEMVDGMLTAFVTTLAIVLILLVVLFRSLGWAILAMLPVVWTVVLVYGVMGWIGKDYDMPIAVLSTLVIGIGIDFAIHFVERQRESRETTGDPAASLIAFFEEPGRALTRNAAIVAVGFTPLLLSSLTPYVVVGVFLSSILLVSWLATLIGLPALLRLTGGLRERSATAKE